MGHLELPMPTLDALPLGAHRAIGPTMLGDEALYQASGVRIAFTGRSGGVSVGPYASLNCASHVGDDLQAVERNRRIVLAGLGAPRARLIVPNQVHGTNVVAVNPRHAEDFGEAFAEASAEAREGADAIVVRPAQVAALLNFADCLPLIIVSPDGSFSVVHAGWRGAVARIASKATRALQEVSGYDACAFNAYIGPHIRSDCFEVGSEVAQAFAREFGSSVLADEHHVSLADAVSMDLASAGLDPSRIADARICTKCNSDEYSSYRAENGACGRHAAVAVRIAAPSHR